MQKFVNFYVIFEVRNNHKMCKNGYFFTIFAGDLATDKPFRRAQEIKIIPSTFGEIHVFDILNANQICSKTTRYISELFRIGQDDVKRKLEQSTELQNIEK